VSGEQLICYYDSRERWLNRAPIPGLSSTAIAELAYLLPYEKQVISTFEEVSASLASADVTARLIEANDVEELCRTLAAAKDRSILWNMTDGFSPVTSSYFPAVAAMMRKRYFGNSAALQLGIQNKFIQYLMCRQLGIPAPNTALYDGHQILAGDDRGTASNLYFVKPFDMANSIGIFPDAICDTIAEASSISTRIKSHYQSKTLIQEYISGASIRVNYIAVDRRSPIHRKLGIHLMQGPSDDDVDFTTFEDHLERFAVADATYAAKATAINLADPKSPHQKYQAAIFGIQSDAEKLVRCFGLRDFFSMDYKITDAGERYFIELNTLPFARNAGLRAYCEETFGLTVGRALGAAILAMSLDSDGCQREW
jgi:D-alanine-D-alanine ligase-like ATP-grasp enzyme